MVHSEILTRTEQKVVRFFGGWQLADLIINPDLWKTEQGGRSHADALGDETHWMHYDSKSVTVGPIGGDPVAEVKWAKVKRYVKTLPAHLIEQLAANQRARREHMGAYKPFVAPRESVGCGPVIDNKPTPEQVAYSEAHTKWVDEVVHPHRAMSQSLDADLDALLDEAFPLADNLCRCATLPLAHIAGEGCEVAS